MLIGIILLKFLTNALALSSAIPSGIFVPMFLIGGIIGRAYGVLMLKWFGITKVTSFAVVGSACLVSSVTHTLAITVITFELVGQINILYEVRNKLIKDFYLMNESIIGFSRFIFIKIKYYIFKQ